MSQARPSRPPLIAITADSSGLEQAGSKTDQEPMFSLASRYCDAIQNAGGLPIIIPHSPSRTQIRHLLQRVDGLLISGGGFDIDPSHYGEQPIAKLGKIKAQRTFTEMESIALGLRRDLPILGICGGAQAINVVLGGSLYQDIVTQLPNAGEHQQGARNDSDGHIIDLLRGTLLHKIFNRRTMKVNTTHHQATAIQATVSSSTRPPQTESSRASKARSTPLFLASNGILKFWRREVLNSEDFFLFYFNLQTSASRHLERH